MDSLLLFSVARAIHIFFGSIALFVAPSAMLTRKGGLWHRLWGKIYFWSMAAVAVTAVIMSFIRSGLFFLLVALFSFYLAFTGYRILYRKKPEQAASGIDWAGASIVLLGSLSLIIYGVYLVLTSSIGTVAIVFGIIGLYFGATDVGAFLHPPADKQAWWFTHMRRMLAAYIATVTAFSVVNFRFLPPLARWLWPTALGTIGILLWVGYYRRRFARSNAPAVPSGPESVVPLPQSKVEPD
jgi:uncharacterized membrane protein